MFDLLGGVATAEACRARANAGLMLRHANSLL